MFTHLRHRTPLVATVMAFGLLAVACGSDADTAATEPPAASQPDSTTAVTDASSDADAPEPTSAGADAPEPTSADGAETTATAVAVPEALQFTAPLVGGGEFTGADYAGKPTVFWFWAPT